MNRFLRRTAKYAIVTVVAAGVVVVLSVTRTPSRDLASSANNAAAEPSKIPYMSSATSVPEATGHVAPVKISPADALAAVEAFSGELTGATVSGPLDAVDHPYYSVSSDSVSANVDADDGHVRTLGFLDRIPASEGVTTSGEAALQAATSFVSAHQVPIEALSATVTLRDHGGASEYLVAWTGRSNGALIPDKRSVSINPLTGEVYGFTWISRPYDPPPAAQITAAEAIERAIDATEPKLDVVSEDLLIAFDESGRQTLVWEIAARDSDGYAAYLVDVDALDGTARIVGRG